MSKDGGPVFPVTESNYPNPGGLALPGMSLREYFAAAALQGMAANPYWDDHTHEAMAEMAFNMADNMLKAREQD